MSYPDRIVNAPTDIPGCVLWVDATDIATLTKDGSNLVAQWNDKSGSANHFTQATPASKPLYTTAGPGGVGALLFDGVDDQMVCVSNIQTPSGCSIFGVLLNTWIGGAPSRSALYAGKEWALNSHRSAGEFTLLGTGSEAAGFPITDIGWKAISATIGTQNLATLRVDGNTATGVVTGPGARTDTRIGNDQSGPTRWIHAWVAEIVVYNRQLTEGERVSVERYLERKYNIGRGRQIASPTELHGCILWLDASDLTSITKDGSNLVSQWSDKSGLANHAVQATPANQPTYNATGFGGLACLDWGSAPPATMGLTTPAISYGTFTAFFVIDGVAGAGYLCQHGTSTNQDYVYKQTHSFNVNRAGSASGKNITPTSGGASWFVGRKVLVRRFDGSNVGNIARTQSVLLDTTTLASADPGTAAASGVFTVGNANASPEAFRGKIAEVVLYNRALTDGEVAQVEQYLNRKWSLYAGPRLIASPLEISDCAIWLDAGQGVTFDANGVSQWNDSSGNARHVAQASDPIKPAYNPANAAYGDKPTIDWNVIGNGARLDRTAADNLALPLTIIACVNLSNVGTTNVALFDNVSGTECTFERLPSTGNLEYYTGNPATSFPNPGVGTRPFIFAGFGDAKDILVRINGRTEARYPSGSNGITTLRIGTFVNGFTSANWNGSIAEFLVYRRRLTDGEIAMVEQYLSKKYGI